jgi:hypothetical protein
MHGAFFGGADAVGNLFGALGTDSDTAALGLVAVFALSRHGSLLFTGPTCQVLDAARFDPVTHEQPSEPCRSAGQGRSAQVSGWQVSG